MTYSKPTIRPIDHQTEIAGCTPCDGSLAAQVFVAAGLGKVYSQFFGPPCPGSPIVGPVSVCIKGDAVCASVNPQTVLDKLARPEGGLPGSEIIGLP